MDKNAIKKYAVWARRELIERIAKKAQQYGIEEKTQVDANADSIGGKLLSPSEKKERQALLIQIKDKGYEQVMEEVAYTWFNRFSALRFMEVNGYLPTHVRVFTDEENNFKPQIITEAIHMEMDGLDMDKVFAFKDSNQTDELYKYLLITQCNALNTILPGMFQKIADYTELLLPDNLLREGSVIEQMITLIPEDDWKDAVQIIGWLYQYYNSEKKDEVFVALKKNVKITKENIPAATQLFTPDWIVRYMVENSLGRLWLEGHTNDALKSDWKYYLDEAEQEADVQVQLDKIREEYKNIKPEEIKCIDPCSGSGHILAYMFDVLMKIYEAYGYTSREAVTNIVENNIYGLDIDERAAQLANFAVMMKARQYDRRFFARKDEDGNLAIPQPHVYVICESNHISKECLDYFANGDAKLGKEIHALVDEMYDAKEYGSILNISAFDFDAMFSRFDEIENEDEMSLYTMEVINELLPIVRVAQIMAQEYDIVVTNPPYMGGSGMSSKLSTFVKKNYVESKSDLFAVFIEKCAVMTKPNRYQAMITQHAFMFLSRYEKLRAKMLQNDTVNMAHLGARAFEEIGGEVVQTTTWITRKSNLKGYRASYSRLVDFKSQQAKEDAFSAKQNIFTAQKENFSKIPGSPIAYWLSTKLVRNFNDNCTLKEICFMRNGPDAKGSNGSAFMFWQEINLSKLGLAQEEISNKYKWYPFNKGGSVKWYGSYTRVASKEYCKNVKDFFKCGFTWSDLTNRINCRFLPSGFSYNNHGKYGVCYTTENLNYIIGFINTNVAQTYIHIFTVPSKYEIGYVEKIPVIISETHKPQIDTLVEQNISISKTDWDNFETSWDFKKHPLISNQVKAGGKNESTNGCISQSFNMWKDITKFNFKQLKQNEEELNRIFIEIYGLQDELTPEVAEKDVTIRKADLQRDIKGLISYAVGCMFGRYSLDEDGLIFAGGDWDATKYRTFEADRDNIIPICDDEYFEDDIVGRFIKFVEVVYGEDTLQENLKFIADALGGKGQPKEVIRNYFMNDFYKDHCNMYKKRPIYWQFDSGKKNGFKCLIYMHRYQPDTIMRIRTDYVHEQQSRYRTAIADLEQRIDSATTAERVKLTKKLTTLQVQAVEIREYEEKIHHLADQMIRIDLDDGVKANYKIFKDVLAKIK